MNPESSPEATSPTAEQQTEVLQGEARFAPDAHGQDPGAAPKKILAAAPRKKVFGTTWLVTAQSLAVSIVIALFVITFLTQAFQIPSESMENTLLIGDYLLVDKVHFAERGPWGGLLPYTRPRRGEIVVFHYPVNPKQYFVKRLIGLPGDHVRIVNKKVLINGSPLEDSSYAIFQRWRRNPYSDNFPSREPGVPGEVPPRWTAELLRDTHGNELIVPAGAYFVLGDNRDDSDDSRYWGFVPQENIVGRPLLIYFSVDHTLPAPQADDPADGKLISLALSAEQFWHEVRWKRMLKVVR